MPFAIYCLRTYDVGSYCAREEACPHRRGSGVAPRYRDVLPMASDESDDVLALLRIVSVRDYRGAPGRLALMLGGIASGVALIAALGIINGSVIANFRTMLERAAGKAALQVTLGTGEVGF